MLTPSQLSILNTSITSDPALNELVANKDATLIANYYNVIASPDYTVWVTNVSVDEIMREIMDWARVDNLTVGKSRIWDWMSRLGRFDSSKANIRAGIDAAWVGTAADLAVRAAIYTHCKRLATRAEKLFSTGTGSVPSPATMEHEGNIYDLDVQNSMGW